MNGLVEFPDHCLVQYGINAGINNDMIRGYFSKFRIRRIVRPPSENNAIIELYSRSDVHRAILAYNHKPTTSDPDSPAFSVDFLC